ncbi:proteolipid protein 2-like [Kryptolebias marmoratus]|uniref:proteolipid protein 2-like n=1 Tax=Kryptolebias marmoratus TaxID=37003 RepID=UPI0007F8C67E|nr:proteolipid protein 2-like [Kryptolebias marmoratus]
MADTTESDPDASCMERLKKYIKTKKGSILAAEMLLNLLVFCCYTSTSLHLVYITLPICELILSMVFFVVFMMALDKKFRAVNWIWSDFFRAIVAAIIYIIISIIFLHQSVGYPTLIASGVLGLLAGLLYGYDTFTIFKQLQSAMQH